MIRCHHSTVLTAPPGSPRSARRWLWSRLPGLSRERDVAADQVVVVDEARCRKSRRGGLHDTLGHHGVLCLVLGGGGGGGGVLPFVCSQSIQPMVRSRLGSFGLTLIEMLFTPAGPARDEEARDGGRLAGTAAPGLDGPALGLAPVWLSRSDLSECGARREPGRADSWPAWWRIWRSWATGRSGSAAHPATCGWPRSCWRRPAHCPSAPAS